jgi:hypothetical protein
MQTYKINCLSVAMSPITHMSGNAGNESIVSREMVQTDDGVFWVPFLSGNALRHKCVREPMAHWLIDRYGLAGKLTLMQLNFLFHGGNLTESTAHENTRRIAEMAEYWPFLRVCGGALPNQILCGSLDVWRGTLVCEENRKSLAYLIELPDHRMYSAERYLGAYQYTRGDAKKKGLAADRDDLPGSNLMIYSGQSVIRGAIFHHGFVLKNATDIELGCLLLSLRLWKHNGGTIGGNARLGHGRLEMSLVDFEDDGTAVDAYISHVDSVKDKAIAWLTDAFEAKKEKAAKGKKGKETANAEL